MHILRLTILLIGFASTSFNAIAQEPTTPRTAAASSEDQMIAEAMWATMEKGTEDKVDAAIAFAKAVETFPDSARMWYWRGKCGAREVSQAQTLRTIVEYSKKLSEPDSTDTAIADPKVQNRLRSVRLYARSIHERIKKQVEALPQDDQSHSVELSLLQAVTLDPSLTAAWANLVDSSDVDIAINAADAWAEQEPNNSLPLYAKAVVLSRDATEMGDGQISSLAIEAIELGNERPLCAAPDEPWPKDFSLRFPDTAQAGKFRNEPVGANTFRSVSESMFFSSGVLGPGATISESQFRSLGTKILTHSHKLSLKDDIRYLRAFVGVGLHLIESNQFMYGLGAGSVNRVLHRLESISIDQRDFNSAQAIAEIRSHIVATSQAISADYGVQKKSRGENLKGTASEQDPSLNDQDATRVMQSQRKKLNVPDVRIDSAPSKPNPIRIGKDWQSESIDLVDLRLFYSKDNSLFVCGSNQAIPSTPLSTKELKNLGFLVLDEAIDNVRAINRTQELRRGFFLLVDSPYAGSDIARTCFVKGYVGRSDAFIVAFVNPEHLESFREYNSYLDVRVAQVLGSGSPITQTDLDEVSPLANAFVVPADRLVGSEGQILDLVRSSKVKWIVSGANELDSGSLAPLKELDSVLAFIDSIELKETTSDATTPDQ